MIVILALLVVLLAFVVISFVASGARARPVREIGMERGLLVGSRNSEGAEREHRPFAASSVRIWTGRFGECVCAGGARTNPR